MMDYHQKELHMKLIQLFKFIHFTKVIQAIIIKYF